jgi:hypothetical protein
MHTTFSEAKRYVDSGVALQEGYAEVQLYHNGKLCWYLSDNPTTVRFSYPQPTTWVRAQGLIGVPLLLSLTFLSSCFSLFYSALAGLWPDWASSGSQSNLVFPGGAAATTEATRRFNGTQHMYYISITHTPKITKSNIENSVIRAPLSSRNPKAERGSCLSGNLAGSRWPRRKTPPFEELSFPQRIHTITSCWSTRELSCLRRTKEIRRVCS